MFDTLCSFPLEADLFAQAVHPTRPLVAVGLSSGHVSTLTLPPADDEEGTHKRRRGSNGTDIVDTAWRTKRHKGSCRCLAYSLDGNTLYSAGTDGIVKAADSESGKVTGKVAIPADPSHPNATIDAPTVVHALSPQTLLLATDSGALHLYDLRDPAPSLATATAGSKTAFVNVRPAQTHHPHADFISSLTPLPASSTSTSGYSKQWITTGGTTLALTDLRRGVLVKSEDQEELLLSSLYVSGLSAKKSSTSSGEKALVGGGDGVITLWEKGQWDDQDERITVSPEKETLDALQLVPEGMGGFGKHVAVGLGDGKIRFVRLGHNRVVAELLHDEVEGVVALDFDVGRRMISGGGQIVKVWEENREGDDEEEQDADGVGSAKRAARDSDDSDDDGGEQDSSEEEEEEEEKPAKRKKKKRKGKGGPQESLFNFAGLD